MRAIEHWVASTHSWVPGRGPHPVVPVGCPSVPTFRTTLARTFSLGAASSRDRGR